MPRKNKLALAVTARSIAALGLISALAAASLFAAPARAASLPSGGVVSVTVTGPTSASVVGSVNPGGLTTSYQVVYDLASSQWCRTNGASGQPANSGGGGAATGTRPHIFVISLSSLTRGSAYCVAIRATNSLGTVTGIPYQRFTAGAPDARAYSPTSTSSTTATLYGGVNPAGQSTTYQVRYDLASSTWCSSNGTSGTPTSTQSQTLPYTDGTLHSVWVSMTRLTSGTSYCATITATNATASKTGSILDFTLDDPGVVDNSVAVTGATTATINGAVNAFGQTNLYYRAISDLASSTWCTSGGNMPDATSRYGPGIAFPYTDSTLHSVSVDLSALTPGTEYCATIAAGTTQAPPIYFTTTGSGTSPSPTVVTGSASGVGTGSPTVSGSVAPWLREPQRHGGYLPLRLRHADQLRAGRERPRRARPPRRAKPARHRVQLHVDGQ
jgi:hypothetical protein